MTSPVRPTGEPTFPVLDTLRAVGALAVLTTHTAFQAGDYVRHGVWGTVLARLDVGVAIFFVLSGFLLSRPYLARAVVRSPAPAAGRYYWKRFIRIYPVYAVTVVIALAAVPENRDIGREDWVRTLLLANVYTDPRLPHGLTQMWSLAAEVAFYLTLPVLMLAAVGRRGPLRPARVLLVVGTMVGLSIVWHLRLSARVEELSPGLPGTWLPAYLTWFAVGIIFALAHVMHESRPGRGLLRALGGMPGVCWSVVAGLMLVAATPAAGPTLLVVGTAGESLTKHLLYGAVGGLVVLTGIYTRPSSGYRAVLSTPLLRHLGHISYSTFCIHLPILHLVMWVTGYPLFGGHGLAIWIMTVVLSLAASELLYRLVEKPGIRLKNLGRRRVSGSSPPSTPDRASTTK